MHKRLRLAAQAAAASGLALLLSTAVFAAPQSYQYRPDRISVEGRITAVSQDGEQYRVTLNHGDYSYLVPMTTARSRDLRVGAEVRIGGIVSGDIVNADMLAFEGEPYYVNDPAYRGVPFGNNGWLSGTVQRVDRHLGYLTIRDDANGTLVKIDVRHMDVRHPVNIWGARAGDHISIDGAWENHNTFDARLVEY